MCLAEREQDSYYPVEMNCTTSNEPLGFMSHDEKYLFLQCANWPWFMLGMIILRTRLRGWFMPLWLTPNSNVANSKPYHLNPSTQKHLDKQLSINSHTPLNFWCKIVEGTVTAWFEAYSWEEPDPCCQTQISIWSIQLENISMEKLPFLTIAKSTMNLNVVFAFGLLNIKQKE